MNEIHAELEALRLPEETDRYRLEQRGCAQVVVEKRRDMLDTEARVFVGRMGEHVPESVGEALERLGSERILKPGCMVAVKVNLGGGITGVPCSYSDLLVVEGIIDHARALGCRPFVCEANMRSLTMTRSLLAHRGVLPLLLRKEVEFVNLSELPGVDYFPLGWSRPMHLARPLLHPDVRVVSVPALKHHWECGITLAQKNMYGAIAERQKSLFHRGGAIDETVAAAARAVTPDISVLAHRQVAGGLGPHFCVPINFGYIVVSDNVVAADRVGCDFMGSDWRRIKHLQINCGGREVPYSLVEGSVAVDAVTRRRIAHTAIRPWKMWLWRALLYPQYFVPHKAQYQQIPKIEPVGTWANWLFCHPRGDPWPTRWRPPFGVEA